jgi:hypothetical protein
MGTVTRRIVLLLAAGMVVVASLTVGVGSTVAGGGFGRATASSTFRQDMTFTVGWSGAADRVEILLNLNGSETTVVAQATVTGTTATYVDDQSRSSEPPNTKVHYRWRAVSGDTITDGPSGDLTYDDDRFTWDSTTYGQTTVHWYGSNGSAARRFGQHAAGAADRAGATLGYDITGGIDIFVYANGDDFFGALGTAVREWTGAATYPELRTVFMRLDAGSSAFLDLTLNHEVTHVVFADATANPFHFPAKWVNEGFAVWSESQDAAQEESTVEQAANSNAGLFAFPALVAAFPIRGTFSLAYAQSATMIDLLIDTYGTDAMARLTAAYRNGQTDDEALAAASGISADQLYADYFARYGVTEPPPVKPEPLLDSDVPLPPQQNPSPVAQPTVVPSPAPSEPAAPADSGTLPGWAIALGLVVVGLGAAGLWLLARRTSRP